MTNAKSKRVGDYLRQADSWARDRQAELVASRRTAWIVASAAVLVAVCEALALLFLMPLKRVEPYTLMVDRQTGYVQLLKPLDPSLVSADAALTQSFLVQYVIAREGFDRDTVQNDYRRVASWSEGQARAAYLAAMPASNPESPLFLYPAGTAVDVKVKSVSSVGDRTAMVRYDTLRHDAGQQATSARPWVAIIRYGFTNRPMTTEERYINPLGFQVLRYRRNPEALVPVEQPPPAQASAPTPAAMTSATAARPRSRFTDRPQAGPPQ